MAALVMDVTVTTAMEDALVDAAVDVVRNITINATAADVVIVSLLSKYLVSPMNKCITSNPLCFCGIPFVLCV